MTLQKKYLYVLLIIIAFILHSCVSYKPKYKGDWQRLNTIENPYYTVYLIGDGGNASPDKDNLVFDHLENQLSKEKENSAIVWLGDNIYPVGLAPDQSNYSKEGRYKLLAQLNTMIRFEGKKFFVPGNHDWYTYGRIGLRRQELLVDSFLRHTPNSTNQDNYFFPDKGCGDPSTIQLADGITLLVMDTHWYLNEKTRTGDLSVCDVKNSDGFIDKLKSEIEKNSDNSLIVASHHPPYTYAHHGGKFPLKDDIFPITQKVEWLYLPLPMAGYIFNRMRLRLSEQDVFHPLYKKYKANLIEALEKKGRSVVASGHEHTLQMIENHNQYFVVSGAGSKNNKVGMGKGSKFSIGKKGYAKLIFKDQKNAVIQFIVPGEFNEYDNIAYEKSITL